MEKLKNIEEKSNVEPKYNINGVAKVKTQEEEENIIKSKENIQTSQTDIGTIHKGRPQLRGRGFKKGWKNKEIGEVGVRK